MEDPDIPFGGGGVCVCVCVWGGGDVLRLKGTVGSFGGLKLIYNKMITRKI